MKLPILLTEPVPELWGDWDKYQEPNGGFSEEETKGTTETGVHFRHEGEGALLP